MKAVICARYGPPEVLVLKDIPKPVPRDHEILVKIHATTVTHGDTRVRAFRVPPSFRIPARFALGFRRPRKPVIGMELAGEVEAVGKDVERFQPGDHVFGATRHENGSYAEYACLPENGNLAIKPKNLSWLEAAAVPVGGLTALYFLRKADIHPGKKVLIYGASGSVGTWAVQLAAYYGAEVTGVCSTGNVELVRSLGADRVIDYTREDFTENGAVYDIVFDAVGKAPFSRAVGSLKKEGAFLHAVATPAISLRMLLAARTSGRRMIGGTPPQGPDGLNKLNELIEAGYIKPVIDRIYPLEEIVEAHRYVDTGRKAGNVAISVSPAADRAV